MKALLACLLIASASLSTPVDRDVVFDAMNDELGRSINQLKIEKHDKPYYVSYLVHDTEKLDIKATFGAITEDKESRARKLAVDVHVGDYKLDSGNMQRGFSWDDMMGGTSLSLDDNYDAIRHKLWLRTDTAYKIAVQNLEKKKAALQQKSVKERPDDWSHEQPLVLVESKKAFSPDREELKTKIKNLSAVFKNYPTIRSSSVSLEDTFITKYFVNNEGAKIRVCEQECVIRVSATAQGKDGMQIADTAIIAVPDERHIPPDCEAQATHLADILTTTLNAKEFENYQGPVLFEKQAAAQFFNRTLAPNVVVKRPTDDERMGRADDTSQSRIGRRILPTFIGVVDDPTLKDETGAALPATFEVDNEGVAAKRVVLVEKGILKTLLSTRLPTLKIKNSSGHGPGENRRAVASNLIIQSDSTLDATSLKAKLLALGKEDGLDYVILVRKLSFSPRRENRSEELIENLLGRRPDRSDLPIAVDVSKVYISDGHEEALRGVEFASTTSRILRDIVATGNDSGIYQMADGMSSVTTPSIIVTEVELQKPHEDIDKPPTLSHPYFEKP